MAKDSGLKVKKVKIELYLFYRIDKPPSLYIFWNDILVNSSIVELLFLAYIMLYKLFHSVIDQIISR